ncbi:MAG TPA: IPT/TIG domain-containing protein [Solirubrobacteraceae bacterium]|jgi:hypothetical protein|nr:IPT/TIG domain-containing protein [Solirubrobacteraceae bacterium]
MSDGTVKAWGAGEAGQLGDGTLNSSATPVAVSGLGGVTTIDAGWYHSLALLGDGTVKAWGAGTDGALGQGSFTSSDVPVTVSGLSEVVAVSAGADHSLALLSNGTVVGWGKNEFGDLGTVAPEKTNVPVEIPGLSDVVAISAGRFFNLALLSNGKVMGWGYHGNGELSSFQGTCSFACPEPVELEELSGVAAVSAGLANGLALLSSEGTVKAWGAGEAGQLGDGTFEGSTPAVSVSGLSGASAIAAASEASFALRADGSAMVWGYGVSDVPVPMSGFAGAVGIAAGASTGLAFGPFATVTAVPPSSGSTVGGTPVNVAGVNLSGATSVQFGSTPATSFTVHSDTSLSAVSPPHPAGTVDVMVTTPVDTNLAALGDRFTYVAPPTVTKVTPAIGSTVGGASVTIKGTSFTGATQVRFGSVEATNFTVTSGTSMTAVTPAEAEGKVDVHVTTQYGTSATSTKDHYTFAPTVTGVSPNSGPRTGGASVTVTGTGFALGTTATKIKFATKSGTSVNCTSSTTCTVVTPVHEPGIVDVRVTVNKVTSAKNLPADQYSFE